MLRYFVASNSWLFIGLLCMANTHTDSSLGPAIVDFELFGHWLTRPEYACIVGTPFVLSAVFAVLYCHTVPAASLKVSLRTLLVAVAILAVLCGFLTIAFSRQ